MRKLLLISTALIGFVAMPDRTEAAPLGGWVATAIFGAGAAGTAAFAIVSGVVAMAASIGLSMIAQALLGKKPKSEAVRQELTRPTSLPAYRFVYGKTWAPGTPVGWVVRGRILYVCYLLNSRPSAGPFTVLFDKRKVNKTGDEFDFSTAGGATATNAPFSGHTKYWIGRGEQTTCPAQIVAETGGYFIASDAWRGRTVLWARLNCGDDDDRQERWPTSPPELNVDGNWSLVIDPRDGLEKHSRNQGLIVLDALRNNPVRRYANAYLRLDTFSWAADVADQAVAIKEGGYQPRYRCDGILVFGDGAELEDQIQPLLDAGASRLTRIGGKLAMVPCATRLSVKTITDFTDGQPLDLVRWRSSDDLYTEAVARFPAPDRAYESAETPAYVVGGAQAEDGGAAKRLMLDLDFVTDHRQAQRLAKIAVLRSRMQRQVSGEIFPDGFDLVAGSICRLNLPAPYEAWNQKYEVQSIAPAAGMNDDESITLRLPIVLSETSDAITAWDAAAEEQDVTPGNFDGGAQKVLPPPSVSIVTGSLAAQVSGDTTVPAILAYWAASPSASAYGYDWEWATYREVQTGDGDGPVSWKLNRWNAGGQVAADAADEAGLYYAFLPWPSIGGSPVRYAVRVRARGSYGASAWIQSAMIEPRGPVESIPAPEVVSANPATGEIAVTALQVNSRDARRLLIYGSDSNSPLTATLLWDENVGANVTITRRNTGLGSGITRY
ncbi:phage tail protein, partial [Paracoccus sp. (in: a-proteobacteria)]|uniref:phage tail protein n=1 Tax=Paracoccus sp. TaxID=267 RepID=UPI002899491A